MAEQNTLDIRQKLKFVSLKLNLFSNLYNIYSQFTTPLCSNAINVYPTTEGALNVKVNQSQVSNWLVNNYETFQILCAIEVSHHFYTQKNHASNLKIYVALKDIFHVSYNFTKYTFNVQRQLINFQDLLSFSQVLAKVETIIYNFLFCSIQSSQKQAQPLWLLFCHLPLPYHNYVNYFTKNDQEKTSSSKAKL